MPSIVGIWADPEEAAFEIIGLRAALRKIAATVWGMITDYARTVLAGNLEKSGASHK